MWMPLELLATKGLLWICALLAGPGFSSLQWINLAQVSPAPAPTTSFVLIAVIFAIGGLLLLLVAMGLSVIALAVMMKKGLPGGSTEASGLSEPKMPINIETELSFSTGDAYDSDPDSIATEVFVRAESIPPEEIDTLEELPGVLRAIKKPD